MSVILKFILKYIKRLVYASKYPEGWQYYCTGWQLWFFEIKNSDFWSTSGHGQSNERLEISLYNARDIQAIN